MSDKTLLCQTNTKCCQTKRLTSDRGCLTRQSVCLTSTDTIAALKPDNSDFASHQTNFSHCQTNPSCVRQKQNFVRQNVWQPVTVCQRPNVKGHRVIKNLGEVKVALKTMIQRNVEEGTTKISSGPFIRDLLSLYGMTDCKVARTPAVRDKDNELLRKE